MEGSTAATAAKTKTKVKTNKKGEKEKDPKGKSSKNKGKDVLNYSKFEGQGLNYKCKLFGFVEVPGPRGDKSSIQAIHKLKLQARQMKKGANERKLKIIFNVSLRGIKIINEKTQTIGHQHQIHKISFISHDPEDRHVFGYIYSPPRTTNDRRKYFLFAIKSEKSADQITSQLYELFQVVYKMQETQKTQNKESTSQNQKTHDKSAQPLEPLQDQMLLEMSTKLGGEHHTNDEHLYAEPTFVQKPTRVNTEGHYSVPSDQSDPTESESPLYETLRNGIQEAASDKSVEASSPFTHDPFSSTATEENEVESSKELNAVSQVFSENTFPSSFNDDSGFEAGFDSATSLSLSTEPKFDESVQFHAEFPPAENGLLRSSTDQPTFFDEQSAIVGSETSVAQDQRNSDSTVENNSQVEKSLEESKELDKKEDTVKGSLMAMSNSMNDLEREDKTEFSVPNPWDDMNSDKAVNNNEFGETPTSIVFSERHLDLSKTHSETETEKGAFGSTEFFKESFEFDSNENDNSQTIKEERTSPFSDGTALFPSNDPFSSTKNTVEKDTTVFSQNDPFAFQGATNADIIPDPFSDGNNMFIADFSTMDVKDDFFGQEERKTTIISDDVNREDDVFEVAFEAQFQEAFEDNVTEQETDTLPDEVTETKNEAEKETDKSTSGDSDKPKIVLKDAVPAQESPVDNTFTDSLQNGTNNKVNTLDMSTKSDYVTLKSPAQTPDPPISPSEFTPPPLPPRPSLPAFDPPESPVFPKEPPALPPRPANQLFSAETPTRKPPELPPRVDLEETHESPQFSTGNEDIKTPEGNEELFSENFESFDFSNVDNPSGSSFKQDGTEFEMGDPFKDPFAGDDPFQTPTLSDPFSTPMSYARNYNQGGNKFDPFCGDDPFATSLNFNQTENEQSDDKHFANFSAFSSSFGDSQEKL